MEFILPNFDCAYAVHEPKMTRFDDAANGGVAFIMGPAVSTPL